MLGRNCTIGRGAYVGVGVVMGDNRKLQNYALVYEPATLDDGVFVGPAAVLTNDQYPRSITPDGRLKSGHDWDAVGVTIRRGASIGARAVCGAGVDRSLGAGRCRIRGGQGRSRLRVGRRGSGSATGLGGPGRCSVGADGPRGMEMSALGGSLCRERGWTRVESREPSAVARTVTGHSNGGARANPDFASVKLMEAAPTTVDLVCKLWPPSFVARSTPSALRR